MAKYFGAIIVATLLVLIPFIAGASMALGWYLTAFIFGMWTAIEWVLIGVFVDFLKEES